MYVRFYDSLFEILLRPSRGAQDTAVEHGSVGRDAVPVIVAAVVCVTHLVVPGRSDIILGRRHVRYAAQHTLVQLQPPGPQTKVPKATPICAYQGRRPEAQAHGDSGHVRGARVYPRGSVFDVEGDARTEGEGRHDQDGDVCLSELGKIYCQTCGMTGPRSEPNPCCPLFFL